VPCYRRLEAGLFFDLAPPFTRRSGLTAMNLLVKCVETSSPLDAISAISSAVGFVLGIFDLALL
jgi:hypothetical protein